jgi:hypothetical protein
MYGQNESVASLIQISDQLKGCDAYICTGSAQSAALFRSYFGKYPHIIRPNKTSVAILTGHETEKELKLLADDVHLYFGLGCRNVTKVYVPAGYDFRPMLEAFEAYRMFMEQHRYKNNFDFQLSILLLNQQPYMSNEISLLVESPNLFSPIGVLHYEYYQDIHQLNAKLQAEVEIQCIVGAGHTPFGTSQQPRLDDYADGIDTLKFLCQLADQINPSK